MKSDDQQTLTRVQVILTTVLKWLKIISAIILFILGLISEGINSLPSDQITVPEEDSVALSLAGLIPNILLGWPLSLLAGMSTGLALNAMNLVLWFS